uniref:Uncharacterized protein n=1 Tax=Aegilops tauschii subsp. strangulata TaxID=200361 RepID=A0A453R2L6_AEGTS
AASGLQSRHAHSLLSRPGPTNRVHFQHPPTSFSPFYSNFSFPLHSNNLVLSSKKLHSCNFCLGCSVSIHRLLLPRHSACLFQLSCHATGSTVQDRAVPAAGHRGQARQHRPRARPHR